MKVLNSDELLIAEAVMLKHLPKSLMVYGFLHAMNRKKPSTLEVIVDTWPDFKVIVCRPDPKNKLGQEFLKTLSFYSMDEDIFKKMLEVENAIDWSTYFHIVGEFRSLQKINGSTDITGCESTDMAMLKELSAKRQVNNRCYSALHILYLPESSQLLTPAVDSELESRIASLDLSHADIVNKNWKFGGTKQSYMSIKNLISNFPSCCITDGQGQPVSWILTYDYCAMGMLYTVPEHRGKGYAKVLVSTMARRLRAEGYPVYCFIEEENNVSYRLLKTLGFTEEPSYRAQWFEFNF